MKTGQIIIRLLPAKETALLVPQQAPQCEIKNLQY
jgi:hypothetical protein